MFLEDLGRSVITKELLVAERAISNDLLHLRVYRVDVKRRPGWRHVRDSKESKGRESILMEVCQPGDEKRSPVEGKKEMNSHSMAQG